MAIGRRISSLMRNLFARRRADEQLDEEVRSFADLLAHEKIKRGMNEAEALREAKMETGGIEQVKEQVREVRAGHFLETLWQDARYGLRMLHKSPGFTAVAVITLALGIGANTAIFSLVNWLVLRPLPIEHPSQVVFLESNYKDGGTRTTFSFPDFEKIQQQTSNILAGASAAQMFQIDGLSVDGNSAPMASCYVTGNFFMLLGVKPALGRLILPSEGGAAGADPVLVLSYSYWKSRFNGDPGVLGKKASVNGRAVTIVGVAPAGFHGPEGSLDMQGYMPLGMAATLQDAPEDFLTNEKGGNLELIARLKSGVNSQQAESALQVVAKQFSVEHPEWAAIHALPLGSASLVTGPAVRPELNLVSSLFLILAGAVLVLACLNVANLCLVRVAARQREVAMRAALGASRGRLVRQLLTESVFLAFFGCGAGLVLGLVASRLFSSIPLRASLPFVLDFSFDWRVFSYAIGAAALTGILVGITPALRASRANLGEILHEGGRTATGRQGLRSMLVVAQVAGSLVLLIVAGLFVRSLEKVRHADLGFDPSHVLNATIDPHEAGYSQTQAQEFEKMLLDRARALPGVTSASLALYVPLSYASYYTRLNIDGYRPRPGEEVGAGYNAASSEYFETMRIPILEGRAILESDTQRSQRVAIVNQSFVNLYWHGQDPIGRHFSTVGDPAHPMEVVGIAKNSRDDDIFTNNDPFYYVPLAQHPSGSIVVTLQLRIASPPNALAAGLTSLVHALEPAMPLFDVQTMTDALYGLNGFLLFQFAVGLAGSMGILGLLLAIVGVYGVVSYSANQRTHEIGIRLALGAQPRQVLGLVLRQGILIAGIGVFAGLLSAAAMAKLVANFLYGTSPMDALTYVATSVLLAAIALLACYIPARRAMRVDPMVALRYE
ncbi:MAG TPA: ABC transporter permease [Candidatus Acidoferrales bacterium]|nr:ABC transporter permease [Candidatus Acidoferrales bacterium]